MRLSRVVSIAVVSVLLFVGAGELTRKYDFSKYDESQWVPVREDRWPSAGRFAQKYGCVVNDFPVGTSEQDLFECKNGVGFAMRVLKDVEVKNGRAELELSLSDRAAPSIAFRVQMQDAEVHGPLYNLVIFNQRDRKSVV